VNLRTLSDRMEKVIYGSSLAVRDKTNSSRKNEERILGMPGDPLFQVLRVRVALINRT